MSDPVKMMIPAAVAAFVRPGTALEERLRGAGGQVDLPSHEQVLLLFCLGKDSAPEVRELAIVSFAALEQDQVCDALAAGEQHPALLHSLALHHGSNSKVRSALLAQPGLADVTRELLQSLEVDPAASDAVDESMGDEGEAAELEDVQEPEGEEFFSKYKLAQAMGIAEKIKMALTGDKEWRKILIKDSNKLVSSGVIKNPRITDPEVLTIVKSGSPNDEVMRLICANREWVKNYTIRKALIENPKTPLANALRYLGTMNEKDLSSYAKSRNISSVVATQAKRLLLNKKK